MFTNNIKAIFVITHKHKGGAKSHRLYAMEVYNNYFAFLTVPPSRITILTA